MGEPYNITSFTFKKGNQNKKISIKEDRYNLGLFIKVELNSEVYVNTDCSLITYTSNIQLNYFVHLQRGKVFP